ncbi:MAG: hypothetical protein KDJ35_03920 [Alphaproteobacteria bacterium]|nr:hypothetical protein [Alphaproteobacteria bacterium]
MSKTGWLYICLFILALWPGSRALAGQSGWASTDYARMRMITGVDTIGPANSFEAALHMRMEEGWHSYWKIPGEAGAPPRFDWSGSDNISDVEILWQAPKRFDEFGFQTFGYEKDVYFPLRVSLSEPGKAATLKIAVKTMVCHEICIPQDFTVSFSIPEGDGKDSSEQRLIDFEKRRVPQSEDSASLRIDTVVAGPDALVVSAYSQNGFDQADMFAYGGEILLTAAPEIAVEADDARHALITISKPEDLEALNLALQGQSLNIVLLSGRDALERSVPF